MPVPKRLRNKFIRAAEKLKAVMAEIAAVDPKANLYVECNDFHLMSGQSHDENGRSRQDRILDSVHGFPRTDCGAW